MIEIKLSLKESELVKEALEVIYSVEGLGFTESAQDLAMDLMEELDELIADEKLELFSDDE